MATKATPLSESHPDVAARWVGNVRGDDRRTPVDFSAKARFDCWWWCGRDDHEWFAARPGEHLYGFRCPQCISERKAAYDRTMSLPVAALPELVAGWRDPRSYLGLLVEDLCAGVAGKNVGLTYSLRCPEGHKIDTVVRSFVTTGCPWCRANVTRAKPSESIRSADPELAAIWHPTRNGDLTPENTPVNYRKPLWWKSVQCCGYEWQEDITQRTLGRRPQAGRGHFYCPRCQSVWGSLAWQDPELAAEWHPDNDFTAWHVKPFSAGRAVKWRCSVNPAHEWEAAVIDRSAGRLCPLCSTAGTSQVEKTFLRAAQAIDPEAAPAKIGRWLVDVLVPNAKLVIEYDGEYWHRGKHDTDVRKTRALIAAGYRVARVRENDLPHLDMENSRLHQVSYWPTVGQAADVVRELSVWASGAISTDAQSAPHAEAIELRAGGGTAWMRV